MSTSRSASRAALRVLDASRPGSIGCCYGASSQASTSQLRLCDAVPLFSSRSTPPRQARSLHNSSSRRSAWPAGADAEQDSYPRSAPADATPAAPVLSVREALKRLGASKSTAAPTESQNPRREAPGPPGANGAVAATGSIRAAPPPRPKTLSEVQRLKSEGVPITVLTAYDYPTALAIRSSDMDICLIGDSLANVALGYDSTQRLTLDAMIHHVQAVVRGLTSPLLVGPHIAPKPLIICDVPFGSFYVSDEEGMRAVTSLLREGGADGVKIEGGAEVAALIRRLSSFGIPVMGHIGLQPQRVAASSGYRLQGRTASEAMQILADALTLQEAGAFAFVLECVPNRVAAEVAKRVRIPVIGIGAGPEADGQVLVQNDMLGDLTGPGHVIAGLASPSSSSFVVNEEEAAPQPSPHTPAPPKFVRSFAAHVAGGTSIGALRMAAVQAYVEAVRTRTFPDADKEGYKMKKEEWEEFKRLLVLHDQRVGAVVDDVAAQSQSLNAA